MLRQQYARLKLSGQMLARQPLSNLLSAVCQQSTSLLRAASKDIGDNDISFELEECLEDTDFVFATIMDVHRWQGVIHEEQLSK